VFRKLLLTIFGSGMLAGLLGNHTQSPRPQPAPLGSPGRGLFFLGE